MDRGAWRARLWGRKESDMMERTYLFICLFLAVLGLRSFSGFSLVAESEAHSPAAARRRLPAVAGLVAEHGLLDTRGPAVEVRGLWRTGSAVVVLGLSCSTACGIVRDQGSNPCSCIGGGRILYH